MNIFFPTGSSIPLEEIRFRCVAQRRFLRTALHFDVTCAFNECLRNAIRGSVWRRRRSKNKTAIRRYVTFTDVVAADTRKRGGRRYDAFASSSAFCGVLPRRGRGARASGIMAVVGASKDQFVRVIMPGGHATRRFALKETAVASRCTEY